MSRGSLSLKCADYSNASFFVESSLRESAQTAASCYFFWKIKNDHTAITAIRKKMNIRIIMLFIGFYDYTKLTKVLSWRELTQTGSLAAWPSRSGRSSTLRRPSSLQPLGKTQKTTTAIYIHLPFTLFEEPFQTWVFKFPLHSLSAVIGVSFFDSNSSNPNSSPCYQINFRRSAASARRLGAFVATCSFQECLPCSAWFGCHGSGVASWRLHTGPRHFRCCRSALAAWPSRPSFEPTASQCKSSGHLWFVSTNLWDDGFDGSKSPGPTFD